MIYKESDYKGCYNLKAAERELIMEAHKKYNGNEFKMARGLKIGIDEMRIRISAHGMYTHQQ